MRTEGNKKKKKGPRDSSRLHRRAGPGPANTNLRDPSPLAEHRDTGAAGGRGGLFGAFVRGHQPARYTRQARHHHGEGYAAGQTHSWGLGRVGLDMLWRCSVCVSVWCVVLWGGIDCYRGDCAGSFPSVAFCYELLFFLGVDPAFHYSLLFLLRGRENVITSLAYRYAFMICEL
jgi:hypothetical protein